MDVTTGYSFNLLKSYTPAMIQNMVSDPMTYNEELRNLSRQLYNSNGIISSAVDFMVCLPTLDKVLVSKGKNKKKNEVNKQKVKDILELIKDKEFIRDALFKSALDGVAFYYLETTKPVVDSAKFLSDYEVDSISEINSFDINASIISLPTDYCKIRGIKNSSYVLVFNLDYFSDYNGEKLENKLKKYPKEIRDGYLKYKESDNGNNWLVLNNEKTIVSKIRSNRDEVWGRSIILGAIDDVLYSEYFKSTKRNILQSMNAEIYVQTFPEGKDKGSSSLSSPQQEKQHIQVRDAIQNKANINGTSVVSVAAGTKIDKVKSDNGDIFDEKNEQNLKTDIGGDLGIAISLLDGSSGSSYSSQQTNLELVFSRVYSWIETISSELNKCINLNIIKDAKNKVEVVYLPISRANRGEFFSNMQTLYLSGHGSLSALIAASGMDVDTYIAMMDRELDEGWDSKYLPHITSYTATDNADNTNSQGNLGGRPKENNLTNENTVRSKTNNDNSNPKPSTK